MVGQKISHAAYITHAEADRELAYQLGRGLRERGCPNLVPPPREAEDANLSSAAVENIERSALVIAIYSDNTDQAPIVEREASFAAARGRPVIVVRVGNGPGLENFLELSTLRTQISALKGLSPDVLEHVADEVRPFWRSNTPVISVLNMKGGVGKTTVAAHVFGAIHDFAAKSVLLIDLDPQHNLTQFLIPTAMQEAIWSDGRSIAAAFENPPRMDNFSIYPSLGGIPEPESLIVDLERRRRNRPRQRLDLIAGHFALVKFTVPQMPALLEGCRAHFEAFIDACQRRYDLIVFDINPGSSFLTEAALSASTAVLSPVRPDRYSLRGVTLVRDLMAYFAPHLLENHYVLINVGDKDTPEDEVEHVKSQAGKLARTLDAHLPYSKMLSARLPTAAEQTSDLSAVLAHRRPGWGVDRLRARLEDVSDEVVKRILSKPR